MKALFSLIAITLFFTCQSHAAGGDKGGNGGDTAYCAQSTDNEFEGYYSLDYILTYRQANNNSDIVPVQSWEASRDRILRILDLKTPRLAASFRRFLEFTENFGDYTKDRVWEESPFGLVNLEDEDTRKKVPSNCYPKDSNGELPVIQTVIRKTRYRQNSPSKDKQVIYSFDSSIFEKLKNERPLQFSFLMVHEWLWDVSEDLEMNRRVDRFLHSQSAETLNMVGFAEQLAAMEIGSHLLGHPEIQIAQRLLPGKYTLDGTHTDQSLPPVAVLQSVASISTFQKVNGLRAFSVALFDGRQINGNRLYDPVTGYQTKWSIECPFQDGEPVVQRPCLLKFHPLDPDHRVSGEVSRFEVKDHRTVTITGPKSFEVKINETYFTYHLNE